MTETRHTEVNLQTFRAVLVCVSVPTFIYMYFFISSFQRDIEFLSSFDSWVFPGIFTVNVGMTFNYNFTTQ